MNFNNKIPKNYSTSARPKSIYRRTKRYRRGQYKGLRLITKVILFSFLIIGMGGIIYLILWSPFFRVKSIIIIDEQGDLITSEEMHSSVEDVLSRQESILIPEDSIFALNNKTIENILLENHKEIKEVEIQKRYPEQVRITIEKRIPLAIWCVNDCVVVDEEGIAFERLEDTDYKEDLLKFEENRKFVIYDDGKIQDDSFIKENGPPDVQVFETVVPTDVINYTKQLVQLLEERVEIKVNQIGVPEKYSRQISLLTDSGYKIMINTTLYSPTIVIDIIRSLYSQDNLSKEQLAYLDLRIYGRALSCLKQTSCAAIDRGEEVADTEPEDINTDTSNEDVVPEEISE